jgi:hypothetical protein
MYKSTCMYTHIHAYEGKNKDTSYVQEVGFHNGRERSAGRAVWGAARLHMSRRSLSIVGALDTIIDTINASAVLLPRW